MSEIFRIRTEISEVKTTIKIKMMISEKAMTETAAILKIKTMTVCEIEISIKSIKIMTVFVTEIFKSSESWENKKKNVWTFSQFNSEAEI